MNKGFVLFQPLLTPKLMPVHGLFRIDPATCFFKDLQKSSDRRQQLSFENSELKAQLTDKIGQLSRILESNSCRDAYSQVQSNGGRVGYLITH